MSEPHNVYKYMGQRIKERRRTLKMNQSQLGQLLGISYQQVQKYENGSNQLSVSRLLQFAHIMNVPPIYFYEGIPLTETIGNQINSDVIQKTRTKPLHILLTEDNPTDVILFKKAMQDHEAVLLHHIPDADMVMDFLLNHAEKYAKPRPDIVILDLSMPKVSGLELLKSIKRNSQLMDIPVVILTNSISRKEMQEVYRAGAAGFIQKSIQMDEFREAIDIALAYWEKVVALPGM